MTAENIALVSAAVVALTQLIKWMGLPDRRGPLVVLGLAALGVALWAASFESAFERRAIWPYFAAWIVVATSAAGVYGFTRSMPEAVTVTRRPPGAAHGGAAQEPTARM